MRSFKPLILLMIIHQPFAGFTQRGQETDINTPIYYKLIRNEPNNSGVFGVVINPLIFDVNQLNLNFSAGIDLMYTYKSKFGVSAGYRIAYFDHPKATDKEGEPYSTGEAIGRPVDYRNSSRIDILTKTTIATWEKEGKYHIKLSSARDRKLTYGRIKGLFMRAITVRLGYMQDHKYIESENGIDFRTTTSPYIYHHQGKEYPLSPDNLSTSSTMMRSNIIVAGIGYSTFRDMKIELDGTLYKGRRQERSQTDLYLDILYAHKLEMEDMVYYHPFYHLTQSYDKIPQRLDLSATPINKMGVRVGYQIINMYKKYAGTKLQIEGGIRPGPKGRADDNLYLQFVVGFMFGGRIAHE